MKNGHALARRSQSCNRDAQTGSGFALVATISILVLLTIIAVGMLTLSSLTLKTDSNQSAQNEAKANARMALMIAIGELQKEMGPDMRVSAEAAIFDTNPLTQTAEGIGYRVAIPGGLGSMPLISILRRVKHSASGIPTRPSVRRCSAAGYCPCRKAWPRMSMHRSALWVGMTITR